MMQVIEPDYYIKIGVKDNRVVSVDWGVEINKIAYNNSKVILKGLMKMIIKLLKDAIRFLKAKK